MLLALVAPGSEACGIYGIMGDLTLVTALIDLETLNTLPADRFCEALSGIVEHSRWVTDAIADRRPFGSVTALHAALAGAVMAASEAQQLALLRAHPELAGRAPLTASSQVEQAGLGLDRLDDVELARFDAANARYRRRFGFPFIIAVKAQRDRRAILAAMEERETHDQATEKLIALNEVVSIARFRLDTLIAPGKIARLTLHVLDTVRGRPGAGVAYTLYRLDADTRSEIASGHTNEDGRASQGSVLNGGDVKSGLYELVFEAGAYLIAQGEPADRLFFDRIPIRFRITDTSQAYHVPLILAAYGYSTYRGS